jgi:hypothetical protein
VAWLPSGETVTMGRPENGKGPLWPVRLILKTGRGRGSLDAAESEALLSCCA